MKRNNRSTTASSSTSSATRDGANDNTTSSFPLPPKMSTRSKRTSGPTTKSRLETGAQANSEDNEDEARDPLDGVREGRARSLSLAVSAGEEGAETSLREECDITFDCSTKAHQQRRKQGSMASKTNEPSSAEPIVAEKKNRNKVAAVRTESEARNAEEKRKKKPRESSSNGIAQKADQTPTLSSPLTSPASFDQEAMLQVVPSSYSFGGLSALKIEGGSGSSSYHGGDTSIAKQNATTRTTTPAIDDLHLMDVDDDNINPSSWDLLNQADSFGFNLLGSHGSLSFENDGDEGRHVNNDNSKEKGNGGQEQTVGDLTSTKTLSMEDQYHTTQTKRTTPREGRVLDTTIVNNSVHSWIPPHISPSPQKHHHQQQQQHYHHQPHIHHGQEYNPHFRPPQPHHPHGVIVHPPYQSNNPYYNAPHQYPYLQESRSDVPQHPSYNFMDEELRDDTIGVVDNNHKTNICNAESITKFDNDPFKYAFGDPASSGGVVDRSRRIHSAKAPPASKQSKKRKQEDRANGSTRAPFHHHQTSFPTLSSKPKVTNDISNNNSDEGRIVERSREPRTDNNRQPHPHGSIMTYHSNGHPQSMAWHDPNNTTNDSIHNAFLPPLPIKDAAHRQKNSSSLTSTAHHAFVGVTSSSNPPPCNEVYITTRTPTSVGTSMAPIPVGRRRPYNPPIVASQYAHHPPHPPYTYPPHGSGASPSTIPPPMDVPYPPPAAMSGVASGRSHPPHQRNKPTNGVALLALRNGKQLSRTQAPGIGWPPEEDARLTEILSNHKSSHVDWEALCNEPGLAGRTARECHDRWTRYLKPGSRKGQWTEEEDAIVLRVIFSNGGFGGTAGSITAAGVGQETGGQSSSFAQWADLAPQLPGRTGKQIRDRWVNYLNPAINHLPFSREDDLLLWQGHKEHGKRWVEISVKVFHSTRSENHIKNRWYSAAFKKFISKEIGIDAYVDSKQHECGVGNGDDDTNLS